VSRSTKLESVVRQGAAKGSPAKADRHFVTALARGLEILRCFSAARTELSGAEIASLTGLPQPTVWRLCRTLSELGYLQPSGEKMRVGTGVLALGYSAMATLDIGEVAQEGMQRLANDFKAASSLATPERLDMLIVRRATALDDSVLVVNLHVGSRLDMANSSVGWAFLASLPDKERAALLEKLAGRHGRNWAALRRGIQEAAAMYQKRGYILNCGSYHPDVNAIAIPVNPGSGLQTMVVNVGSPAAQNSTEQLEKKVAPRLLELAAVLRDRLSVGKSAHSRGASSV
jgi:DNA-binding IclR family transcriptional regulator